MRTLQNLKPETGKRDTEIEKYKEQANSKKIDVSVEAALLDEVRKGKMDAIPKLVDSWEYVIIQVIENMESDRGNNNLITLDEKINAGRQALITLAERESGSTGREIFSRFGAWCIRQAIIKLLTNDDIDTLV